MRMLSERPTMAKMQASAAIGAAASSLGIRHRKM
jgi:hypothetical protein